MKYSKLRKIIREEIGNVYQGDRTVDVSGRIDQLTKKHLKNAVERLEEEFGIAMFGRHVYLNGVNKNGKKVKNAEGVVSVVNVYITDDLKIDLKIKFKNARTYTQVSKVVVHQD